MELVRGASLEDFLQQRRGSIGEATIIKLLRRVARALRAALGIIGYELAFGQLPYAGDLEAIFAGHQSGRARFDLPTSCSQRLISIVKKLMAPHPEARVQSAEQLIQTLASSGAQQESSAQRTSAPPSSGAPPERRSSGDFSSLTRFLEDRFSGRTSTHPEGRVVHSTVRERMLVWLLLAATVATALAGFLAF